jgi:starch synthase
LIGITNGVDYEVWNPETDDGIAANFSRMDLSGKRRCKRDLLETFSLPVDLERPILANITRLTAQKGIDLMMQAAADILATGAYVISLGSGEKQYEDFWQRLRDHAPDRVGIYRGYSEPLAHKIEAGADIFMMPSRFEPCGLNQMYSLRYGTVPVVRAVGGLDDTVENFDVVTGSGNGFKFGPYRADKFAERIYEAIFAYSDPEIWRKIQLNGMSIDNSWENAARKYIDLYEWTKT